jgi:DNA polymerase elongation subunit (family B)
MYKKCYQGKKLGHNVWEMHLWDEKGHQIIPYENIAYQECKEEDHTNIGLNGEYLKHTNNWYFSKNPNYSDKNTPGLHFHDMKVHQKFLVERYGINDVPSTGHREVFFDIECEIGGALTEDYIESAPMPITSIAWWDKTPDTWHILILDKKNQLKHTKARNKEIIPCSTESQLLAKFIEIIRDIDPDILIGYNSDYFDIPYLYYRMCNTIGKEFADHLSPLGKVESKKFSKFFYKQNQYVDIVGVESLDYIRLTKNLSHKGKHNYSEVYSNSVTQDGAISAYLLSQNIIPPPKEPNPQKKDGYAGGYLFCPKAGLYKYMFDEDLTSLYPSIIMSINIGKETFVGRIIDADDRNNRLGLNDLKERDHFEELLVENSKRKQTYVKVGRLISMIEQNNLAVAANGSMFRTDKEAVLSTILKKWFEERVLYKGRMKKAYKSGDKEAGEYNHLMQYTMKILLNSLYGATALPSFRYGMNQSILSEAITLSGHRIIQESALCANRHMNKVMRGELKLEI